LTAHTCQDRPSGARNSRMEIVSSPWRGSETGYHEFETNVHHFAADVPERAGATSVP
jgi:hypothetical protein